MVFGGGGVGRHRASGSTCGRRGSKAALIQQHYGLEWIYKQHRKGTRATSRCFFCSATSCHVYAFSLPPPCFPLTHAPIKDGRRSRQATIDDGGTIAADHPLDCATTRHRPKMHVRSLPSFCFCFNEIYTAPFRFSSVCHCSSLPVRRACSSSRNSCVTTAWPSALLETFPRRGVLKR